MIDFSPLKPFMDELFFNVIKVLILPAFLAIIFGIVVEKIKILRYFSRTIAIAFFFLLVYQMVNTI